MDDCKIPFTRCTPDVPGHPNAPHPGAPRWHCCPEPPDPWAPVPPPIQPVMPVPGPNVQAQMCHVVNKVNECIDRWNYISSSCYEALNKCVGAAVNNDVYYDRDEIMLESGYNTNDECTYHVINVKCVDKANKPIHVKLGLAYDNSTNSNLRQSMQDVSFIKNANVILTAVDPAQAGWEGRTMYMGAPIAFTEKGGGYVGGFNDHGALKIFASDVDDLTLRQNCIMDCIGGVIPIIVDGEITEQAKALTTKASISAIGYKSSNGDKVFFQCSAEKSKGMQGITVANLLKDMGCTTAMITCVGVNSNSPKYSNGMMYMGASTDVPNGWLMPQNVAYWFISKRPFDGWRNKFTSEIADLVQRVGGSWNEIEFNKHRIEIVNELAEDNRDRLNVVDDRLAEIDAELDDHEQRITQLETDLAKEIKERKEEITRVDGRIDQEITDRKSEITRVDGRIDQEITDRTAADTALGKRIDQEITDRTNADTVLQANIDAEAKARADADLAEETERKHQDSLLEAEIDQERKDRAHADADLAERLQTETTNRTSADTDLLAKITAEADTRAAADTKLTNDLAAEATARKDADVELTNEISAEATARKDADAALRNQIDAEEATRSSEDTKLRDMINGEINTRATEDDAINDRIDGIEEKFVKKSGDTMTGSLLFQGATAGSGGTHPYVKGTSRLEFVQGECLDANPADDGHTPAINAQKTDESTGKPYYINVRGADAVIDDDFVTKKQMNETSIKVYALTGVDGKTSLFLDEEQYIDMVKTLSSKGCMFVYDNRYFHITNKDESNNPTISELYTEQLKNWTSYKCTGTKTDNGYEFSLLQVNTKNDVINIDQPYAPTDSEWNEVLYGNAPFISPNFAYSAYSTEDDPVNPVFIREDAEPMRFDELQISENQYANGYVIRVLWFCWYEKEHEVTVNGQTIVYPIGGHIMESKLYVITNISDAPAAGVDSDEMSFMLDAITPAANIDLPIYFDAPLTYNDGALTLSIANNLSQGDNGELIAVKPYVEAVNQIKMVEVNGNQDVVLCIECGLRPIKTCVYVPASVGNLETVDVGKVYGIDNTGAVVETMSVSSPSTKLVIKKYVGPTSCRYQLVGDGTQGTTPKKTGVCSFYLGGIIV